MTLAAALTLTATSAASNHMRAIDQARDRTHRCERQLGLDPTPVSQQTITGARYRAWVLALWRARAKTTCRLARDLGHPAAAIRAVFGEHTNAAMTVARCESGLSTRATNGQYQGMFQMGSYARSRYGHGDTPLEQARAAHRYFLASGRDWSPWQCRPGGLAW